MLFLFNWKRATTSAQDDEDAPAGAMAGSLKVKQKRRRLSAFKPLRDIEFPMHELGDDEDLLLMLGVI